jgi:Ser/Thr protein kinase RdoA (MazF antagonist)
MGPDDARHAVLFEHLAGAHPDPSDGLVSAFDLLGAQTARLHHHAAGWTCPDGFTRFAWDESAVFGTDATWGNWRDAPNLTLPDRALLERVERVVRARLSTYGKAPDRYGLIHADLRLANVLIDGERLHLIDFDDCGFGWRMYDFAAAISFMEDDPAIPALKTAWCAGYRRVLPLPARDEAMIDTMIMLRRLALLAWIGSHMDSTEPQALAPHFASTSAQLGAAYLEKAEIGGNNAFS